MVTGVPCSLLARVRLSVCWPTRMYQHGSHWTDFREILYCWFPMKIHPQAANLVTNEQKYRALYIKAWLLAGRSADRIPVGARFSAPVQTGPGARPASCTMGTGSFPGVKSGRDVTLTPTPFWCRGQERVELYLYFPYGPYGLYRASVRVQGCTLPLPFYRTWRRKHVVLFPAV